MAKADPDHDKEKPHLAAKGLETKKKQMRDSESALVRPTKAADILLERGIIGVDQLNISVNQHRRLSATGERVSIDDIIVMNGFATRAELAAAIMDIEEKAQNEGEDIDTEESVSSLLRLTLPYNLTRRLGIRPLRRAGRKLVVAATRPLAESEKQELISAARATGLEVDEVFIAPRDKKETLAVLRHESQVDFETLSRKIDRLNNMPDEGALIQDVIHDLLIDAIQNRASDIHIDNIDDQMNCWISLRIDGDLRYRYLLSADAARRIATRLKNDSGMDFSDARRPQDGRFPFTFEERKIDVRVASMPIDGGETLTLRLLDPAGLLSMRELFMDNPVLLKRLQSITKMQNKTGGLFIVSGPTGSGKTTTLYAILRQMDRHRLNVMTVEDPIEYRIPLVRQSQVMPEIGATFGTMLRSQLRHDPDILVIGEMRDAITAETALRSAESGHFVLTTLHSADSLQTIERMVGLFPPEYRASGIYVLSHYLWGVVNQRLMKRVCQACGKDHPIDEIAEKLETDLSLFGMAGDEKVKVANAEGCSACGYSGYHGRVLLAETIFFPNDQDIRHQIAAALLEERYGDVLDLDGVTMQSRAEAAASLLRRGIIDPEKALAAVESLI